LVSFNTLIDHYAKKACALMILAFMPHIVLATTNYQVELLIFEQTLNDPDGKLQSHETWPHYVPSPYPSNAQLLSEAPLPENENSVQSSFPLKNEQKETDDAGLTANQLPPSKLNQNQTPDLFTEINVKTDKPEWFTTLPIEQFLLTSNKNRLSKSSHYRVLTHKSWIQPFNHLSHPVILESLLKKENGWDNTQLKGTISIQHKRFHQVKLNLLISHPGSNNSYHLAETRNIKEKSLQYFDHPKLGALLFVKPLEETN